MAGLIQYLFGSGGVRKNIRRLSHPRDLRTGDIIKLGYGGPSGVTGKQFEIEQINTYIYGDMAYPELVLKDNGGDIIFLMVEEEDGEEYLAFSKKLQKSEISLLIDDEKFEEIRKKGRNAEVVLHTKPEGYTGWLADIYKETDDRVKGAFVKGDARYLTDKELKKQEKFTAHILTDESDEKALELEVYKSGEIELSVTVYLELNQIKEMWPHEANS